MLFDEDYDENGEKCKKSRYLPYRLYHPNVISLKTSDFHSEIVEQDKPGLKPHRRSDGEHYQELIHGILLYCFHRVGFLRKRDEIIPINEIPPATRNGTVNEFVISARYPPKAGPKA